MALGREASRADAFDYVFNAHHGYIYNLVYLLLRNAQDAEDVTQDVFIRAYKAMPGYKPEQASMRTWLSRFAVNACQSHRRRSFLRARWLHPNGDGEEFVDSVDPSLWGAPEAQALQSEVRQTVQQVLAKLPLEHRTVLVLHYYFDLPCPEIANIISCPEGTVYSRLHYARRMVQERLERHALHHTSEVGI